MTGRARAAMTATLLLTLAIPAAAYASPTSHDHGFGNAGVVTLHHTGTKNELLVGMTVLSNGKTMLLIDTLDQPAFEVHRLLKNGKPDRSYGGGDGVAAFGPSSSNEDSRLTVDPKSGKSYVSSFLDNGSTSPTTVWRLKTNGQVDKAYGGGDGRTIFNHRLVLGLLALPGGKLLMAGDDFGAHTADVWRITDKGKPDRSFGSRGKVVLSTDVNDEAASLVRQPDGRIVVAGSHYNPTTSTLLAWRLKPGGARDRSFGAGGKIGVSPSTPGVTTSTVWSPQVLLRPDGRTVYVAGLNQNDGSFRNSLFVAGLSAKGKADHGFGKHVYTGISETDSTAALQRDGKLVVAGFITPTLPTTTIAAFRFTSRGALDHTWSDDGVLTLPDADGDTPFVGIAPTGRVLVGRPIGLLPFDARVTAFRGTRTPTCHGKLATQFGSGRADTLVGTPGADVLVGLGGKDTLKGLGGNDVLCGNGSADRLIGGSGNDALYGGPGDDRLVGGTGHNTLVP